MKRVKKIMFILVLSLGLVVVGFMAYDGTLMNKDYAKVFNDDYIKSLDSNAHKIVATALRAGSSHNMQPWLVEINNDNNVELYADMSKTLTVVDKDNYQLLISQGTFIKAFETSALNYGYDVEIEYNNNIDFAISNPLIANLKLVKTDDEIDAISSSTSVVYEEDIKKVDLNKGIETVSSNYETLNFKLIDSNYEINTFKDLLLKGTIIESQHEGATVELLNVFRWTERDKNEKKYGLSLTSMPNVIKPFIQPIMKLTANDWESFGQSSIKMFEERLESEIAYIVITCDNPTYVDYIKSGEVLQELSNELNGYSLRPAVQLIQDIDGMEVLTQEFNKKYCDVQKGMLIITVKEASGNTQNNPRNTIDEIIIN